MDPWGVSGQAAFTECFCSTYSTYAKPAGSFYSLLYSISQGCFQRLPVLMNYLVSCSTYIEMLAGTLLFSVSPPKDRAVPTICAPTCPMG